MCLYEKGKPMPRALGMTDHTALHGSWSLAGICSSSGVFCHANSNAGFHAGAACSLPGDTELGAPLGHIS